MTKLEPKKNIVCGIIMYAVILIVHIIWFILNIPYIFRGYASAYTWCYVIEDSLIILCAVAALVIMLVRKKQSGFGVASPMIISLADTIFYLIAMIIENSRSYYYTSHPTWNTYLSFLIIIPITVVIIYFFTPNTALKITSASLVSVAFLIKLIIQTINILRAVGNGNLISNLVSLFSLLTLYSLIIVQIFISFKKTAVPAAAPDPAMGYAPVQPTYAQPAPQAVPAEQVLANYQNLLNQNLITKEQFDEKRRELFGE